MSGTVTPLTTVVAKDIPDESGVETLHTFEPLTTWVGEGYEAQTRIRIVKVRSHVFMDIREYRIVKTEGGFQGFTKRGLRFKLNDLINLRGILPDIEKVMLPFIHATMAKPAIAVAS